MSQGEWGIVEATPEGYVVTRPGGLRAWFHGRGVDVCDVVALTPGALWLEPNASAFGGALSPGLEPLVDGRLWVEQGADQIGPIDVHVGDGSVPGGLPCRDPLRTRLTTVSEGLSTHRRIASWISGLHERGIVAERPLPYTDQGTERVVDPAQIDELLRYFSNEQVRVVVRAGQQCIGGRIVKADSERGLVQISLEGPVPPGPAQVEVVAAYALYSWPVLDVSDGLSATPEWVSKTVRRKQRRCTAPPGTYVRFRHPQWGSDIEIERPVEDLAHGGLSFHGELAADLLYPGLSLPEVVLVTPGGKEAVLRAQVRTCARPGAHGAGRIGMQTQPADPSSAHVLRELVERALYPRTKGKGVDGWRIYTESGYLNLSGKRPQDFDWLRDAYVEATRKLEIAPDVARLGYWPAKGNPAATVSHLRVSSCCWIICHVSKVRHASADSRQGLAEVYMRVYEQAKTDPQTRWLLTYVQDAAPTWSKRVHLQVPQRFTATGEGCTRHFRALECDVERGLNAPATAGWRVQRAQEELGIEVMRDLCRIRPAQYLDALDLTETQWKLSDNRQRWHARGLRRERVVFVALDGGRRVAAAVAELAEPGVHLFSLLDCVRLYALTPDGSRAFEALLQQARAWYASQGCRRFVLLSEEPELLAWQRLGFTDLGGATLTLLSAQRMPEMLQTVCNLSSSRPPPMRADASASR